MTAISRQRRVAISAVLVGTFLAASCSGGNSTAPDDFSGVTLCAGCPGVFRVEIMPRELTILVGETVQLEVEARDPFGTVLDRPVTWTSSSTGIATVTGAGLVTGAGPGTATITATAEGRSGTATVQVNAPPPPSAA